MLRYHFGIDASFVLRGKDELFVQRPDDSMQNAGEEAYSSDPLADCHRPEMKTYVPLVNGI